VTRAGVLNETAIGIRWVPALARELTAGLPAYEVAVLQVGDHCPFNVIVARRARARACVCVCVSVRVRVCVCMRAPEGA
jgi:hypothetical protein